MTYVVKLLKQFLITYYPKNHQPFCCLAVVHVENLAV